VRTSGNDSNDGTQRWTAFRTIAKAAEEVSAGDTVYVGAGTYSDSISVVGIQGSGARVQFIADVLGSNTNDAGPVVISGAQFTVAYSNHVALHNFTFTGPGRPLLWLGSYDGLVEECEFDACGASILLNAGSLTMENCVVQDGLADGVQVDGESELVVRDSEISGCQGCGLEVRKTARVTLIDSFVEDNQDDGLRVALTDDTIDHGFVQGIGPTPDEQLEDAYEILDGFLFDDDDKDEEKNHDRIDKALEELIKAFTEEWWIDEWHLDLKDGDKVFKELKDVVKKLKEVIEDEDYDDDEVKIKSQVALDLVLAAAVDLCELALEEAIAGDGEAKEIEKAQEEIVKAEEELDKGKPDKAVDNYKKSWEKSKKAGGDAEGTLTGWTPPIAWPPSTWEPIEENELTLERISFSGNSCGLGVYSASTFEAIDSTFNGNSSWGIYLTGAGTLEECEINDNGLGGLWLKNTLDTDLDVTDVMLTDNTVYGVYAEQCTLSFHASRLADLDVSGSEHLFCGSSSTLSFSGVTLSAGATAGVLASGGTLNVSNSTIEQCGYGIAADHATVLLDQVVLAQNGVGLYSDQNDNVTLLNCQLSNNSQWGAVVKASPADGTAVVLQTCTVYGNAGGLSVSDAENGDLQLSNNTVIRDNTLVGLNLEDCTLTLDDQVVPGVQNWQLLRNGVGLQCVRGTVMLRDATISECSGQSVRNVDSTLSIESSILCGETGLVLEGLSRTTVASTRFNSPNGLANSWGIHRTGGDLDVKNCVFDGFENGVYLATSQVGEQVAISNATIANVTGKGVWLASGDAAMTNCIVAGNSASTGLADDTGALTHTYNLIHGFATACQGTSSDATEVLKDPQFVDAANGNLRLDSGSPAINAGTDLSPDVMDDMDGNARPSFYKYELGAYEYLSANGSLRILEWVEQE
jgi:hypothetical protein